MEAPCEVQLILRYNQMRRIDTATFTGLAKAVQTTAVDLLEEVTR
jgi:hypothetical protein